MFPPSLFLFLFAVLDVACAGTYGRNKARLLAPSLHDVIRRQVSQNTTATNATTNATSTLPGASIVPLVLASDKQTYYSVVSLGNISLRLAFDTASSDIWAVSSGCNAVQCRALPRYPLTYDSPTFVSVNNNASVFNVSFADTTTASGFVAEETILLGALSVPHQVFGLMNSTNITFIDQVSGVFGLGFPRLSSIDKLAVNATPFFAELAQQGQLDYPLFGVSLERNKSLGSLSIGAVDSSVVSNASLIEWNQVIPFEPFGSESNASSYLQWAIRITNITVGTQNFTLQPTYPKANSNHSVAIFDIGTAGIFGPYQDVERIFSSIDSSRLVDPTGQWAIPCDTNLTMAFTFNEESYTLLPSDYIIGPTAGEPELCLTWPKASPPSPDGIDWQIGSAFLRTVYTVFSYGITKKEAPMIGLYPLQPTPATPLPSASLSALFSSLSLIVPTTLPNFVISTPTFTTSPYIFNTSVPASVVAATDLATSTYAPIIAKVVNGVTQNFNASALPTITPTPTLATILLTGADGAVRTSVSPLPTSSVVLGQPPGSNSAKAVVPYTFVGPIVAAGLSVAVFCGVLV
ncbi:aspartic peptidase domain-containing protein [Gloeopeniophorella convolvens]|nr:aspartic peptidase domain-containing protein [Gloeopeniophorella convolvens]